MPYSFLCLCLSLDECVLVERIFRDHGLSLVLICMLARCCLLIGIDNFCI